jgi:hypothetical protein
MSEEVRLGIDVACTAVHQASLADERGVFLWQGWRLRPPKRCCSQPGPPTR